jgi:Ca2+-binding RTX toxin-like protein
MIGVARDGAGAVPPHDGAMSTNLSPRRRRLARRSAAAAALLLAAALPAAAQADVASFDGSRITVTGSDGNESISLSRTVEGDIAITTDEAGPGCRFDIPIGEAICPVPSGGIYVNMGGGNDQVTHLALTEGTLPDGSLHVDLGPGDDEFQGAAGREEVAGGAGNDTLTGADGDDALDGGDGNDTVTGDGGRDTLQGGAGDDVLDGDRFEQPAADVIDGGPGTDRAEGWTIPDASTHPSPNVTLDGQANDGRPGEGDDVRDIELLTSNVSGSWSMSNADDVIEVWSNLDGGASTIRTLGGNDQVTGGNHDERIDGGVGNDRLEGGYGNDRIVGGAGRDTIIGDMSRSDCGILQSCSLPQGNDVIDARDGERDTISCGVGRDTVTADRKDVVSGDCERVKRR